MITLRLKNLYISALAIVIAVLVLLVFISISTYRNLDRAERNAMEVLHRQGSDLIHVLSAALQDNARSSDKLVGKAAASDDIAYLYRTDPRGIILQHSDPQQVGDPAPGDIQAGPGEEESVHIRTRPEGFRVYELAGLMPDGTRVVIGLKMTAFDDARQADFHHAIIMVAIVVALGAGALFFFFVIHNYYSVEKTLERTREQVRHAEKLAAIGKLAAGVAHEIRNPLGSIRGFAQFLSHTLKGRPEEKEYADIMVREVDRINRVVSDLLTFARPLSPARTRVALPELADHSIRLVDADARSRNVAITRHFPEDLPPLWLDPGQITQALLNLLLNALQATGDGGHIEVGAVLSRQTDLLRLWVEDDGWGIPAGDLDKILDPFFTTRDKGTGLGLAIVHKIAENHRGEIRIESPPPGRKNGTRITLRIPGVLAATEGALT